MTRIRDAFVRRNQPLLIACTVAGDPTPEISLAVIRSMITAGADMIELIVPSTNPVADGPVIRRGHERAIRSGNGIGTVFSLIEAVRRESEVPIILMTYANPVIARGEDLFLQDAARAGADGILVVDMPPEEGASLITQERLDPIFIIAPSTPTMRMKEIGTLGRGFLYLVSAPGVTGRRDHLPADLGSRIETLKAVTNLPVAVGFGIGSAGTAEEAVSAGADAVIAGSAITAAIEASTGDPAGDVRAVVGSIRGGIRPS
ncbi:hypothetical protein RJ53_10285 [Methanocalculus chunghsingensis]|uniref:Tryptophan synthase alpha chain n=1 Tax=Methanocalculus chunghsingensis TaxID=156457 RepID=A0A8J7WBS5_9EURY|nr:tryptophan synthase subunit alpha [Methanocalculus chunghsingensis]MBR1369843.1 hypothetical protein [Methanocalculus chunghsingensis]